MSLSGSHCLGFHRTDKVAVMYCNMTTVLFSIDVKQEIFLLGNYLGRPKIL